MRDLTSMQVYFMKHIGFLEIKGKKAYPFVAREKDILEYLHQHQLEANRQLEKNNWEINGGSFVSVEHNSRSLQAHEAKKYARINGVYVTLMYPLRFSFQWKDAVFFMYHWVPSYPLYKLLIKNGEYLIEIENIL